MHPVNASSLLVRQRQESCSFKCFSCIQPHFDPTFEQRRCKKRIISIAISTVRWLMVGFTILRARAIRAIAPGTLGVEESTKTMVPQPSRRTTSRIAAVCEELEPRTSRMLLTGAVISNGRLTNDTHLPLREPPHSHSYIQA